MPTFLKDDLLTKVSRYNLIREGRMLYIDVHESIQGALAAPFVAVPNLINIVAQTQYQGTGDTEAEALEDCLERIRAVAFEDIFPQKSPADRPS